VATTKGRDFSGFLAWLVWCVIHIWTLIGFRRRIFVTFSWLWSYLSFTKSARLITGKPEVQLKEPRGVVREDAENS
jgi:NADH dehydrogenase